VVRPLISRYEALFEMQCSLGHQLSFCSNIKLTGRPGADAAGFFSSLPKSDGAIPGEEISMRAPTYGCPPTKWLWDDGNYFLGESGT
jgi:hypothetical protein